MADALVGVAVIDRTMSTYEMAARSKKAAALVDMAVTYGIRASELKASGDLEWAQLAVESHVHAPSEATRAIVIERLKAIEAEQREESKRLDAEQCETGSDRTPPKE